MPRQNNLGPEVDTVEILVTNLKEEYPDGWIDLWDVVDSIGRAGADEDYEFYDFTYHHDSASSRVHIIVNDKEELVVERNAFNRSLNLAKVSFLNVKKICSGAFLLCRNLTEAYLPNAVTIMDNSFNRCVDLSYVDISTAKSIGASSFNACYALRHVKLHPEVSIDDNAFFGCSVLMVLAASAGFELNMDPTYTITQYLKWRCHTDDCKERFKQWHLMLKLSNWHEEKHTEAVRCEPVDPVSKFLFENQNAGVTSHILSFFGKVRGYGDLRDATKERLLTVALEHRVLRKAQNRINKKWWGVKVDDEGLL
eukprot:CAMPEP_0118639592 /NCGR_PEP_ID=MMETSP0785-20121206/4303_1 /TAXON_ID=91992 /ORGANISM="Bolidomonas pacifica, Strain CCMP 1866" /LENGTH=309 /DNA_ID=CAMNT_0006530925 /DNA_START=153 /DNA_END=1079 /DNA_ORIENTATION=+